MDFGLNRWNPYELTAPDGWEADLDAGGMEDEWMCRCGALGAYGVGDRDGLAIARLDWRWVARGRLGGISSLSSNLSAVAERAGWLRRRTSEAQGRLKVFDPDEQRRWNKDVDGHCRMLMLDGTRCGKPTVEGSRWCAGHVDLWDECDPWGHHVIGWWRGIHIQYTLDGAYAHLSYPEQVSLNTLRETIAESKETLDRESPYGTDDLCTREDIARWTTMPDEYVEKR